MSIAIIKLELLEDGTLRHDVVGTTTNLMAMYATGVSYMIQSVREEDQQDARVKFLQMLNSVNKMDIAKYVKEDNK